MGGNRICLNMIVKNESKVIERFLDSVFPLLDTYCICDTGSTDNTIQVINDFFERKTNEANENNKKPIQGKIIVEPFVDFSHNRNIALEACRDMEADWILLLDADMVLKIETPSVMKSDLLIEKVDVFYLHQGSQHFYYKNMRIIKNNGGFKYVGATHEYIQTPPGTVSLQIPKEVWFIEDCGDGGSKEDKYERDIRLLLQDTNNERSLFYLANSYFDTRQWENALSTYQKRIDKGGWEQEIWYSHFRMGLIYKEINQTANAIEAWLKAYEVFPPRVENLYEIIKENRLKGYNKTAMLFYTIAKNQIKNTNEKSRDDYLFLHNDVYTYKLDYEYTIIAAYNGIKDIREAMVTVINKTSDSNMAMNLFSNLKFYSTRISDIIGKENVNEIDLSMSFLHPVKPIEEKDETPIMFYSSSSCIVPFPDETGYLLNVRCVNYRIERKTGAYLDCQDHIITNNMVFRLSKDFEFTGEQGPLFPLPPFFKNQLYVGVEDVRLFSPSSFKKENEEQVDSFLATFLATSFNSQTKTLGMAFGEYNTSVPQEALRPLPITCAFPTHQTCEKNWVATPFTPFSNKKENETTAIIYKWFPLEICILNKETQTLYLFDKRPMPTLFQNARGSSCGVKFNKEVWFVVHWVSYETPRRYYHGLVVMDEELNLKRYSAPFTFEGESIEYCLSLIVEESRIVIPYSVWDNSTKIAVLNKTSVEREMLCFHM